MSSSSDSGKSLKGNQEAKAEMFPALTKPNPGKGNSPTPPHQQITPNHLVRNETRTFQTAMVSPRWLQVPVQPEAALLSHGQRRAHYMDFIYRGPVSSQLCGGGGSGRASPGGLRHLGVRHQCRRHQPSRVLLQQVCPQLGRILSPVLDPVLYKANGLVLSYRAFFSLAPPKFG